MIQPLDPALRLQIALACVGVALIAGCQASGSGVAASGGDPPAGARGRRYASASGHEFPGLALGSTYRQVAAHVPAESRCARKTDNECSFVDPNGYRLHLTEWHPRSGGPGDDRLLFAKFADRDRGPPLPLGVSWSDSPQLVLGKLAAAGLRAEMRDEPVAGQAGGVSRQKVFPDGCLDGRVGAAMNLDFTFEDGRLVEVRQHIGDAY